MRIYVGMPHNRRQVDFGATTAFYHPLKSGTKHTVNMNDAGGPEVLCNHNCLLAGAIDRYEAGEIDAFALIHSDVAAEPGWLDILAEEMEASGADAISAVIPIKDERGLTSTAVDDTGDTWMWRRLTMKECAKLPKTFTDADINGPLCLNTGLLLIKFGPWVLKPDENGHDPIRFRFEHGIKKEINGQRRVLFKPDDWLLSRDLRALGLKLAATQAVGLSHCDGGILWSNRPAELYGWEEDIQNGPNAPWRIALARGFILDAPLAGAKAKAPDGTVKGIKSARQDGAIVWLKFEDDTEARMNDCWAVAA